MIGVIYQYNINGKLYIGKTYTKERKRQAKHKFEALSLNKHTPFSRAIRKYGWEYVLSTYSVIEKIEAETKQELNKKLIERESYWIETKNSLVPNGYNIYSKGQITIPHTYNKEEIYERVRKSLKGKYLNNKSSRMIYCLELDTWYPSIREAERQTGIRDDSIGKCASGVNPTAGGYHWSYDGKTFRFEKEKARKKVIKVETGEIFNSILEASKSIDDKPSTYGQLKTAIKKGWACKGNHYKLI